MKKVNGFTYKGSYSFANMAGIPDMQDSYFQENVLFYLFLFLQYGGHIIIKHCLPQNQEDLM